VGEVRTPTRTLCYLCALCGSISDSGAPFGLLARAARHLTPRFLDPWPLSLLTSAFVLRSLYPFIPLSLSFSARALDRQVTRSLPRCTFFRLTPRLPGLIIRVQHGNDYGSSQRLS